MSSKRNKNHNSTPHHLSEKTKQFEEQQLQHLQSIINHLANKVFLTLGKPDAKLYSSDLGSLRIYAQYLNLYMKFKDKCFSIEYPKKQPQHQKSAQPVHNENKEEVLIPQSITQNDSQANGNTSPNRLNQTNNSTALLMSPTNGSNTNRHKT